MTDLEISKQLALAIEWKPEQIIMYEGQEYIGLPVMFNNRPFIKLFDYRFWLVIGPIAERYDAFPNKLPYMSTQFAPGWAASTSTGPYVEADTPQKAIALAVIRSRK